MHFAGSWLLNFWVARLVVEGQMAAVGVDTFQQSLNQGLRCHQAGQLTEAERFYRQAASASPENANVLHLLGSLLHQKGQTAEGLDLLRRAIDLEPQAAVFHLIFANALARDIQIQEEFVAARLSLALASGNAQAHFTLGRLHETCEQLGEAEASYRKHAVRVCRILPPLTTILATRCERSADLKKPYRRISRRLKFRPADLRTHKNIAKRCLAIWTVLTKPNIAAAKLCF